MCAPTSNTDHVHLTFSATITRSNTDGVRARELVALYVTNSAPYFCGVGPPICTLYNPTIRYSTCVQLHVSIVHGNFARGVSARSSPTAMSKGVWVIKMWTSSVAKACELVCVGNAATCEHTAQQLGQTSFYSLAAHSPFRRFACEKKSENSCGQDIGLNMFMQPNLRQLGQTFPHVDHPQLV